MSSKDDGTREWRAMGVERMTKKEEVPRLPQKFRGKRRE